MIPCYVIVPGWDSQRRHSWNWFGHVVGLRTLVKSPGAAWGRPDQAGVSLHRGAQYSLQWTSSEKVIFIGRGAQSGKIGAKWLHFPGECSFSCFRRGSVTHVRVNPLCGANKVRTLSKVSVLWHEFGRKWSPGKGWPVRLALRSYQSPATAGFKIEPRRPERWIITIPSSDQWLATIGNHWKTIATNGFGDQKPLKNHC